jgi:hypothetical protein
MYATSSHQTTQKTQHDGMIDTEHSCPSSKSRRGGDSFRTDDLRLAEGQETEIEFAQEIGGHGPS